MPETFVFDSRIPVGKNVSENDPNHPKNIMRNALIVQNQATADTKYDIYPPPRVEGFKTQEERMKMLLTALSLIVAATSLVFLLRPLSFAVKIVLVFLLSSSLHYLVGRLENWTL